MSILHTDYDSIAKAMRQSLGTALEERIKKELMLVAEKVVSDVARELAKNIQSNVAMYHSITDGEVRIALSIDGVKQAVEKASMKGEGNE